MLNNLPPNLRGMLAMMAASAIFVFSDALLKLSTQSWPVSQVMVFRGVIAVQIALAVIYARGDNAFLHRITDRKVFTRGVCEGGLAIMFILALARMPLADLTSLLMTSPLVITAVLALFFAEKVGWRRWSAIILGFIGVLMVVQPGGGEREGYYLAVLLGCGAVLGVSARDITTMRIDKSIPSTIIMLATTIGATLGGCVLSLFETWQPWHGRTMLILAGAAALVTCGNFLMIVATRGADLAIVAPFRYSAVLFAIPLGYFLFGDQPDVLALAGMATVVISGIYLMHRERVRRRERQQPAP